MCNLKQSYKFSEETENAFFFFFLAGTGNWNFIPSGPPFVIAGHMCVIQVKLLDKRQEGIDKTRLYDTPDPVIKGEY